MKIALPVEDKLVDANVSTNFGRAPYFLIYDTASKEGTFIENSAAKSQGGAGIKAAQVVADSNVVALLTPRCGDNAAKVLNAADVKIYKTNDSSVFNTVTAFIEGELPLLEEIHPGFHGRGDE